MTGLRLGGRLRGPAGVLVGTAVLGASGYGFLALTARAVAPADYAALASLYLLVALVGPALFMPLEQETARVVTTRLAHGDGTRDAILQFSRSVAGVLVVAGGALAALGPLLVGRVFAGHAGLWWALFASLLGFGGQSIVRGVFAARRRLTGYGVVIGVDGLIRLLPCVGLAAAAVSDPVPYALAFGLGPLLSSLLALPMLRLGERGPRLGWRELATGASWLVVAWALSLTLANIAPVIVTAMLPDEPERAGTFAFAFVLVRLPLFVLFALQSVLLPTLAHAVASHDVAGLRRGIRQALTLVGAVGAVLLVVSAPLGGWIIRALFDGAPEPSAGTVTLLAAGTVLAMVVQILQPALLAIASHRQAALAWLAGAAAFVAVLLIPVDPVAAATGAQLAAGAVTAAIMAIAMRRHPSTGGTPRHARGTLSPARTPEDGRHDPIPLD